jgi:hypothetical protein
LDDVRGSIVRKACIVVALLLPFSVSVITPPQAWGAAAQEGQVSVTKPAASDGDAWDMSVAPAQADLQVLLASPLSVYLSGAGKTALWLMTGQIPRVPSVTSTWPRRPAAVFGPEVRVNKPAGDSDNQTTQSEVSLAVFGDNIVVGWNDSSICCVDGATRFSGYGTSNDGGITFTDRGVIPAPTGIDLFGDPSVVADSEGNFYYASLGARGTLSGLGVAKSTDGGQTFPVIRRADVNPTNAVFQDKEYLAVDASATSPFRGNLYIAWGSFGTINVDIDFARSTDGGLTWSSAIAINSGGVLRQANGAVPAVDRAGRIYVVWEDFRPGLPTGSAIFINRSDDGGVTFGSDRKVADVSPIGSSENCGEETRPTLNGSIRVTEFPTIAVDASGGPHDGNVYVAWNDNRSGNPDILFARSTDGGVTWSTPVRVNDDATTTDQFMPAMTVDASGVIYIGWYDRRLDPINNRLIDVFSVRSNDGGVTFGDDTRITTVSFDVPPLNPNFDPGVAPCYMGDYNGVTADPADPTAVYGGWGDNRDLVGARPDPDVFFIRVQVP